MSLSERLIAYFAERHLLSNLIFFGVLLGGVFAWHGTQKEEMPAFTFDRVRVSVSYPGAPAEDVEYFVTEPLEEKIREVDGVFRITSNSSVGSASVSVELEPGTENIDAVVNEIRAAALDVRYPDDVVDDPRVRVFKTTKKAILDVALLHTGARLLDIETRRELQRYAYALETRLTALPHVNSVTKRGWRGEEIQVRVRPEDLRRYDIPFNAVQREIRQNHVRQPAGTIETRGEPKVTLLSELNSKETLSELVVQGGFEGQVVRLDQIAEIEEGFAKTKEILKVNGREAVMFNVVKSPGKGILDSLDAVVQAIEEFRSGNLREAPIEIVLLDDESIDVRNRLKIIGTNGTLGFFLVLMMLFTFLNWRAGIWVAMGIPFSLCFTMIIAAWMGKTINGTTLAAVIIVMGIVVDDAIVVAENIAREIKKGVARAKAVVSGASFVLLPIVASITTTCVAFVPLFFFEGRFGRFNSVIPPIIFLMLGASFIESFLILPGHLNLGKGSAGKRGGGQDADRKAHWFEVWEGRYARALAKVLPLRGWVFLFLAASLALGAWLISTKMKFEMFPREETRDIVITGMTPRGSTRYDTARKVLEIEAILDRYLGRESIGYRTTIARGRRGGAALENKFRILFEIVPKEKREKSADLVVKELEAAVGKLEGFSRIRFRKSRWGSSSGSPMELLVQQNDDAERMRVVETLREAFEVDPDLANPEIEEGQTVAEYRIKVDREKIKRLSITATDVASTFRAALEGKVVYEFSRGDEEVRVRLTTVDAAKSHIDKVLAIPVENTRNYLVPLGDVVSVRKVRSPSAIARRDLKRTIAIFADIAEGSEATPLGIAERLERDLFPKILRDSPTSSLIWDGEVADTRESGKDFRNAAILAGLLIFGILAVLFNSLRKPLLIMLAIPFGVAGVIFAFFLHGKAVYGFYALVGTLGLSGVVINDSIIMMVRLEAARTVADISRIAKTRLRAVVLTTLTTVAGVMPTAYGLAGYDAMLAEMMLALAWGMVAGTVVTLLLIPCLFAVGLPRAEAQG